MIIKVRSVGGFKEVGKVRLVEGKVQLLDFKNDKEKDFFLR